MPDWPWARTTDARRRAYRRDRFAQRRRSKTKVVTLQQDIARELELTASADILLWDDYYAPGYGTPNEEGMEAVKLLARLEGILLIRCIPVRRWRV